MWQALCRSLRSKAIFMFSAVIGVRVVVSPLQVRLGNRSQQPKEYSQNHKAGSSEKFLGQGRADLQDFSSGFHEILVCPVGAGLAPSWKHYLLCPLRSCLVADTFIYN